MFIAFITFLGMQDFRNVFLSEPSNDKVDICSHTIVSYWVLYRGRRKWQSCKGNESCKTCSFLPANSRQPHFPHRAKAQESVKFTKLRNITWANCSNSCIFIWRVARLNTGMQVDWMHALTLILLYLTSNFSCLSQKLAQCKWLFFHPTVRLSPRSV